MKLLLTLGLIVAEFVLLADFLPALSPARPQPPLTWLVVSLAVILIPLPLIGIFILWPAKKSQ